jgi:hypothetical protein
MKRRIMTHEENERIKELNRLIYIKTMLIRECKKEIVNARKERMQIGNDKTLQRKRNKR